MSGIIIGTPAELSPNAFREVFLVRGDSGAVIAYDAQRVTSSESLAFSVPFLLEDIDAAVAYVVVARVTDGLSLWTGPGVPVITQGAPYRVAVPVVLAADPSVVLGDPVPEAAPSPQAWQEATTRSDLGPAQRTALHVSRTRPGHPCSC